MAKSRSVLFPVTDKEFSSLISAFPGAKKIAVAVSGGGDSLALLWLLSRWSVRAEVEIHALTVDHGLRKESAGEAKQVAAWVQNWPNVKHTILKWRGNKPTTRIMERAREARYVLMAEYCNTHKINHLFLAHHQNDQAETVLMRLLHGSGHDGLAGMSSIQKREELMLIRPLLGIPHTRLLETLKAAKQEWIEDPSNENRAYLRPRLRKFLEEEGLSTDRLAHTATRLSRARAALEGWEEDLWRGVLKTTAEVRIERAVWEGWPEEIRVRLLSRGLFHIGKRAARLERIETAVAAFSEDKRIVRLTLQGCVVTRGEKTLKIVSEKKTN